jgi:hypothetical protein
MSSCFVLVIFFVTTQVQRMLTVSQTKGWTAGVFRRAESAPLPASPFGYVHRFNTQVLSQCSHRHLHEALRVELGQTRVVASPFPTPTITTFSLRTNATPRGPIPQTSAQTSPRSDSLSTAQWDSPDRAGTVFVFPGGGGGTAFSTSSWRRPRVIGRLSLGGACRLFERMLVDLFVCVCSGMKFHSPGCTLHTFLPASDGPVFSHRRIPETRLPSVLPQDRTKSVRRAVDGIFHPALRNADA